MIITCPNCNKQFKIDSSLIPKEGRDLQCGSCNNVWFYKIEEENSETLQLKEIVKKEVETKIDNKEEILAQKRQSLEKIKKEINNEKKETVASSENKNSKVSKFFSYLIVLIISFVALIVLLDTLKSPLINVFPDLEIILFSLFETLQDIKLFIIDLI